MKKKILALVLALSAVMTSGMAFAKTINIESRGDTRAILMCYDENGTLVYSKLCKDTDGALVEIPSQYDGMKKKLYYVDSKRFVDADELAVEPTETPVATPVPTSAPTLKPSATPKPTQPSTNTYPSIYEKGVDAIYAPAVVKEVETTLDASGNEVYGVTVFQMGEEKKIPIETDVTFASAPIAYSYIEGKDAGILEEGDVIAFTANTSGTKIKNLDFLFRPTKEDIVTGGVDYGTNFEELFTSNGSLVANQWKTIPFGSKATSERYQYAFGIVGKRDGNTLTLINIAGKENEGIDIDLQKDTIVYTCDSSDKNFTEIGSISDITTSIPKSAFNNDEGAAELIEGDYSYNYALVRIVNKIATDVVVFNNYND